MSLATAANAKLLDWEDSGTEFRYSVVVEYPGLSATQAAVVRLFERAHRERIDAPTHRRIAELVDRSVAWVRQIVRALVRRSWLECQPTLTGTHSGEPKRKRYRLTRRAIELMERRDGKAVQR